MLSAVSDRNTSQGSTSQGMTDQGCPIRGPVHSRAVRWGFEVDITDMTESLIPLTSRSSSYYRRLSKGDVSYDSREYTR